MNVVGDIQIHGDNAATAFAKWYSNSNPLEPLEALWAEDMPFPCHTCCQTDDKNVEAGEHDRGVIEQDVAYALSNISEIKKQTTTRAGAAGGGSGSDGVSLGSCVLIAVVVSCLTNAALLVALRRQAPAGGSNYLELLEAEAR